MSSSRIERKLAAIMFTDIAGYTALSAKDENKALALLDKQEQILTPIIEEFNGTLHNRVGDGLLFTFPTVTEAIKCGIKIQEETKAIEDLNLRIGIHEGEITIKDGDALGDDVNVASRIDPFAAEGGIVISGKVQQNISSLPEFETTYVGTPKLKGVAQKVEVYCITSHGLPKTDISKVTAKLENKSNFNIYTLTGGILTAIGIAFWIAVGVFDVSFGGKVEVPSIGILMMENLGKEDEKFWSSGMTADLITKVAGAGLIRVAPLKDIRNIDSNLSIEEIAKKLRVKYILTHNFLIKDDGFDLWCKLQNTENGVALFSKKLHNMPMNMTTRMVGKLANEIITSLKVETKQDVMTAPTANAEAYEYYLKAKDQWNNRQNIEDVYIARKLYKKSASLDNDLIESILEYGKTFSMPSEYDSAQVYFEEALLRSKKVNNKHALANSYYLIGRNLALHKHNRETGHEYINHAKLIFEEIGDKKYVAACLRTTGIIYNNQTNTFRGSGDYKKYKYYKKLTLEYYNKSLKIIQELNDTLGIARMQNNIGAHYKSNYDYDKALEYVIPAMETFYQNKSKVRLGWTYRGAAESYYRRGDYERSIHYINKSIEIKHKFNDNTLMDDYILLAKNYIENTQYQLCIESLNKALELYYQIDRAENLIIDIKVYLYSAHEKLNIDYDIQSLILILNNLQYQIPHYSLNFYIFLLIDDKSYLEKSHTRIKKIATILEPDVAAKFLSYPIPKAIVEEWEKVK